MSDNLLPSSSSTVCGCTPHPEDRTVPDVVTRAAYKLYGDSTAVTDLRQFADRGHSLTVDAGWPTIAEFILGWLASQNVNPSTTATLA